MLLGFFYSHSYHFAVSYKNGILTCHWEHTEPFKSPDNRYRHSFQIECPLIHKVLACTNCICLWRYFQHSAELYLLHSIAIDCLPNTFNSNSIHLVYTPVCQSVSLSVRLGYSVSHWLVCVAGWVHSFIHWNVLVLLRRLRHSWMPSKPASVLMRCDNSALSEREKKLCSSIRFWCSLKSHPLLNVGWVALNSY